MRLLPLFVLVGCPAPTDTSGGKETGSTVDTSGGDTGETGEENTAPSAPVVAINPAAPSDGSTLRAVVQTPSVDAEGDAVSYRYEWLQNGTVVAEATGDYVLPELTTEGDVWTLNVYPSDNSVEGAPGTSSATVHNEAPTAPVIHLEPTEPATGDDLVLVFDTPATDANNDALTQTIEWSENGTHNVNFDGDTSVDGVYVDGGDTFRVVVTVTDGMSDPLSVEASVSVPNAVPEITAVVISPSAPDDSDDLVCAAAAKDADASPLTKAYTWYRDGVVAADVGDTNTVDHALTTVGEQWECEVAVTDGIDTVSMLSAAVEIAEPRGYRITSRVSATVTTDASGVSSGTGTAEWDVYVSGYTATTDVCDIYWTLLATEDKTICRGCTYSFSGEYTYDATSSSVTAGCAGMTVDSTGTLTFERRSSTINADLYAPYYALSSYYGYSELLLNVVGTGGYGSSGYGYSYGNFYGVTEGVDSAGNVTLEGYRTKYFYY